MKVLIVCDLYKTSSSDSSSQFVHNQVKALQKRGIDVRVMSLDMRSIRRIRRVGFYKYKIDDVTVYKASIPCGPVKYLLEEISCIGANIVYNLVNKDWGKPDIIHAHFFSNGYYIKNIVERNNIPLVITEHSSGLLKENINKHRMNLAKRTYSISNKIICVSKSLKKNIQYFYEKDISVIPNIVPDYFTYHNTKKNKDEFSFVSVGRLIKSKRFDLTINAFKVFNDMYPKSMLNIVGEGELYEELVDMVEELNLTDNVCFLGKVDNDRLLDIYNQSHCFILPSDYETFGVVYIEAMACGLPVISTRCGGPDDIVNKSNGVLVSKNDIKSLLEAMVYIYNNYSDYDSKKISSSTISSYSEENISNKIIDIYKDLVLEEKR